MFKDAPVELNEENVLRIYNDCIIDESFSDISSDDVLPIKIFTEVSCGQDSPEIVFDRLKIQEYYSAINYLFGQLELVHKGKYTIYPEDGFVTYTNDYWTKEHSTLMALYYLGVANKAIPIFAFDPSAGKLTTENFFLKPTLSPNDPDFR